MISKTSPMIFLENNNGVVVVRRLARQQHDAASLRAGWLASQRSLRRSRLQDLTQHHLASHFKETTFISSLHRLECPSLTATILRATENHLGRVIPLTSPAGHLSPCCSAQAFHSYFQHSSALL